jgi:hypothetical protein
MKNLLSVLAAAGMAVSLCSFVHAGPAGIGRTSAAISITPGSSCSASTPIAASWQSRMRFRASTGRRFPPMHGRWMGGRDGFREIS